MKSLLYELQDVGFSYAGQLALRNVSVRIGAGERIALLGANGSGKSTLLRLLDALCFADVGEVRAFGMPLCEEQPVSGEASYDFRRRVGLVFQNADVQLFNATVFDEVAFGPLQLRWERKRVIDAVEEALAQFGISALRDRSPHRLSGGEKKRVALASVLVMKPDVLLLDEPTAALDPKSQREVVAWLADRHTATHTIITATHDLNILPQIADRAIILQDGEVVYDGDVEKVLREAAVLRSYDLAYSR